MATLCAETNPVVIPRPVTGQLDGFFAPLSQTSSPEIESLAADVIVAFERLRAPAGEAKIERPNPDALRPPGLRNLCGWGYPTSSNPSVSHDADRPGDPAGPATGGQRLAEHLSAALRDAVSIGSLSLFVESEPGAPFGIRAFHALDRMLERKAAQLKAENVFTNARIVLPDEVVEGTLVVRHGLIAEIDITRSRIGEDLEGDFLLPGLVELHTDHLECHYAPRPGVRWDVAAAVQAHDAQIATSGITTVFDCLRMGNDATDGFQAGEMRKLADAIEHAQQSGRLRAEHLIHLRCEVSSADVLEHFREFEGDPRVRLASLMDHTPGQRQFQTMEQYTLYYKTKRGLSNEAFARFVEERQSQSALHSAIHRREIAAVCNRDGVTLASHDDATLGHVAEAVDQGVRVAEFPTSIEAARASHEAGLKVLMGAPNVVRGGSHSGNIAARDLADAGLLDVLSSDYVPFSLLHAVFALSDGDNGMRLPEAAAFVTSKPADAVCLEDRGRIRPGLRADLVRVRRSEGVPHVQSVWRGGRRVA